MYVRDPNAIVVEPMKNRSEGEHLRVYDKIYNQLTTAGFTPQLQKMDNEASTLLKNKIQENECAYQLVPPDNHRANPAERAIQTFKDHFISILCTTDPDYPLYLWDKLLPQAQVTLNLMRRSNIHPQLSAYAHMYGNFNYDATPMAPVGTKAVIYNSESKRGSWDQRGEDGWYVGPTQEH